MADSDKDKLQKDVAQIAENSGKLLREVSRLRGDIRKLNDRLEPYEDEYQEPPLDPGYADLPRIKTLQDALNVIAAARKDIQGAEHGISAIRGRVDQLINDAWSRGDFKEWIAKQKRPG